nr:hypothetical protein [Tanacetum cinerariifolium]
VVLSARVESSKDKEGLGDYEDASKQGRSIVDIDQDKGITLTLIEIKAAKPKALTTAVSTRPKEKGSIMQEPSETPSSKPIVSSQQPSQPKDKGKAKMVEPERPLKKKEQIMMD